jgi:cytochrome c peroxidase
MVAGRALCAAALVWGAVAINGQDDPLVKTEPLAAVIQRTQKEKPTFAKRQEDLLAARYDLANRAAPGVTMSRGKAVQDGVRVKLARGMTWDKLATMTPEEIKNQNAWPAGFFPLPHPHHESGGMTFPKKLIEETKKQTDRDLERFDVDFDLPDHLLPEFPAAIFLVTRPDLGDVSKGELVTTANFERLFKDILNQKQLEGLRLLLTPFPQQQFNQTEDRRSMKPSLGVACFDCHANGHTNSATHTVGDIRPNEHRRRHPAPLRIAARAQECRGFHRVRAAGRVLRRRHDARHAQGGEPARPRQPGAPDGRVPEPARLPAGTEAEHPRSSRSGEGERCGEAR